MTKISDITKRFTTETIKVTKQVMKNKRDPKTQQITKVPVMAEVDTEATVIMAEDFNALVQAVFEFPTKRGKYDVRLDLWSALQEGLDHHFNVSAEGLKSTRPAIDNFRKCGGHIGMVKYLLSHFVQTNVIHAGRYVIRFK